MSMNETSARRSARVRWLIPATAAAIGVGYLVAGLVGDDPAFGIFGLLLMLGFGAAFVVVGRSSETVAGLLDRKDERINQLDERATLFSGAVTLGAILTMCMVEIARGQDGAPYVQLGALAGVAYVAALVFQRFRR